MASPATNNILKPLLVFFVGRNPRTNNISSVMMTETNLAEPMPMNI